MDLEGITVLDFTHLLPGPYATQLLADAGAEVIKVEPPTGEAGRHLVIEPGGAGSLFSLVNRGKQSVTLDLKADDVAEVLEPLFEYADVVIEQFRPGVAARLGIGEDDVRAVSPDVVYCSLTGYGQTGPKRNHVGHDLLYMGEVGLLDMNRPSSDDPPVLPGVQVADVAGGLVSAFSIVSALLSRELGTSNGEYIDVSMTDAALSFSQVLAASALFGGEPRPGETVLTGAQPCYDVYGTADDRYVAVGALEPQFWAELCEALGHDELVGEHLSDDPATRQAVRETLSETFKKRTRDEWTEFFGDRDVMVSPVRQFTEAIESPQLQARNAVLEGDGESPPRIGFPAACDLSPSTAATPELGADTDAVLKRVGVDATTRQELDSAGVLGE